MADSRSPQQKATAHVVAAGKQLQAILKLFEGSAASFSAAQVNNIFLHLRGSLDLVETKAKAAHEIARVTTFDIDAIVEPIAAPAVTPVLVEASKLSLRKPAVQRDGVAVDTSGKPVGRMSKSATGTATVVEAKPKQDVFKGDGAGFLDGSEARDRETDFLGGPEDITEVED